jgi:hypothetical protein
MVWSSRGGLGFCAAVRLRRFLLVFFGGLWVRVFAFRFLMLFEGILFFFKFLRRDEIPLPQFCYPSEEEFGILFGVFVAGFFFGSLCRSLNSTGAPPR